MQSSTWVPLAIVRRAGVACATGSTKASRSLRLLGSANATRAQCVQRRRVAPPVFSPDEEMSSALVCSRIFLARVTSSAVAQFEGTGARRHPSLALRNASLRTPVGFAGMRTQPTDTWPSKRTRWRSVIEQSRNYDNGCAARLCDNGILVARRRRSVSPSLEILSQWIPGSPR